MGLMLLAATWFGVALLGVLVIAAQPPDGPVDSDY